MRSKLTNRTFPMALLLILVGLTLLITGPAAPAAESKKSANPAADLPAAPAPPTTPGIDAVTGLPLSPPPPLPPPPPLSRWKDPSWPDPPKVLADVRCDGIPLGEVAEGLRRDFKDAFDVLIPNGWQDPNNSVVILEPRSTPIKMQLKNVKASEVFNAMNLIFETDNSPYRWELKMNGTRPTAILRVLPQLLPPLVPPPPPMPQARLVYFVGDLIGDEKSGAMTMEQLVKTVSEVYSMSYGPAKGVLQFHKDAQLIIVTGTGDQMQFVQQTLSALREKARTQQQKIDEPKAETKTR